MKTNNFYSIFLHQNFQYSQPTINIIHDISPSPGPQSSPIRPHTWFGPVQLDHGNYGPWDPENSKRLVPKLRPMFCFPKIFIYYYYITLHITLLKSYILIWIGVYHILWLVLQKLFHLKLYPTIIHKYNCLSIIDKLLFLCVSK